MDTLTRGTTGPEVVTLQDNLWVLEYVVYATGVYDADTTAAVLEFRRTYWGEPGSEECEQHTYDAIAYVRDQRYPLAPVPSHIIRPDKAHDDKPVGYKALLGADGEVIGYVKANKVNRAGNVSDFSSIDPMGMGVHFVLEHGIPGLDAMRMVAGQKAWTYAIGFDFDLAFGVGGTAGFGIYIPPDGNVGLYASFGADIGAVAAASASVGMIVMFGGPELLGGTCYAIEVAAGLGLGFSGAILFHDQLGAKPQPAIGIASEVGIGPSVGTFTSVQHTWLSNTDDERG